MKAASRERPASGPPRDLISYALRAIGLYLPIETGKRTLIRKYAAYSFDRARASSPIRVRRNGLEFELDLSEEIELWIFLTGWWEKTDLQPATATLKEGQTVLDVGANIGLFTLHAARAIGSGGRVFAFEPNPLTGQRLTRNLELNNVTNVLVQPLALSDHSGDALLFLPKPGSSGGASLLEAWRDTVDKERPSSTALEEGATRVRLCTLDSFCKERSIDRIDYIKVDVEGAEPSVLLGGQQTLRSCRPSMMIECNRTALSAAGWEVQSFLELLWDLGYETLKSPRFGSRLRPVTSAGDVPEELCNLHCQPR